MLVCDDFKKKFKFYQACKYYNDIDKDVFISFDLEFGQNRIGLMQIKFDIGRVNENVIFLIDPYDFQ